MAKAKNLNGLPGNLALSYLSTLGYYDGGYVADWLNYIAREKNVAEIEIDILNKNIIPKEVAIKPLSADLEKLKVIIQTELKNNAFEMSFIKKAIIRFEIPIDSPTITRTIYCYPYLENENGKIYKPKKRIMETAYEISFNSVSKTEIEPKKTKLSLFGKIKRMLKGNS
ncbi:MULTISPECIES: hypothetical protein [unclassified Flavobacterium]|uniref:hypothetical protein n=1 Tax=unclassified Flavobacterium TaxID=196869 RepID=UPI003F906861